MNECATVTNICDKSHFKNCLLKIQTLLRRRLKNFCIKFNISEGVQIRYLCLSLFLQHITIFSKIPKYFPTISLQYEVK